jgi:hypothetical protein
MLQDHAGSTRCPLGNVSDIVPVTRCHLARQRFARYAQGTRCHRGNVSDGPQAAVATSRGNISDMMP